MQVIQSIFIFIFLLFSTIPFCLSLLDLSPKVVILRENRVLTEKPSLKDTPFQEWPKVLEPWFQDCLAFRSHYVALYLKIWEEWLSAPVGEYATGYENDVFYVTSLKNYLGVTPITPEKYAYFKLAHAGLYAFFKTKNIPYVFVTIPDKTSLYPELLPFWAHWCKGESWYDQFTKAIKEIGIPWIDLFPVFKEKKATYKVYNKNYDTMHMNAYGVETCYQEIGKRLQFPELMPTSRNEFYTTSWDKIVISKFIKENVPVFQLLHTDRFQPIEIPGLVNFEADYWHKPRLISNNKPLSPLTVWLVTDSYFLLSGHQEREYPVFRGDIPLLAYHTKNLFTTHVQYFLSPFFQELLKRGPYPDILIETLVERNWTTMDRAKEDPFIRIAGDIYLHTPGYLLTPKLIEQCIYIYANDIAIDKKNKNKITFTALRDPYIELPSVITDADGRAMIGAHVHSSKKTYIGLFYKPKESNTFNLNDVVWAEVQPGKNTIHLFFITEPHKTMDIRVHFGYDQSEYTILPMPEDIQHIQKMSDANR